jgi:murein DD-endopeptidase MepM/ murein hydrolase activator NlpD
VGERRRPILRTAWWLASTLVFVTGTAAAAKRADDTSLVDALQRELGLTRSAAEVQRGMLALDREQASLQYSAAVLGHASHESMRKLAAYQEVQGDREATARRRARALVKLARGGVASLAFAEVIGDEPEGATALRLTRARSLHALVRHDLKELASHRRAQARASAELVAATRELQALGAVGIVFAMQADVLERAGTAVDPALADAARAREKQMRDGTGGARSEERALLALVRDNWRELRALRGLDGATRLERPVPGAIVGTFGDYDDAVLDVPMTRAGVELAARRDQPVETIAGGRVVLVTELPDYGGTVVVDHGGGQYSLTSRLWKIEVAEGAAIEGGATLGKVAPKPIDDGLGPTVYLELRHGEKPVDPAPYLARAQVEARGEPDAAAPDDAVADAEPDGDTDAVPD